MEEEESARRRLRLTADAQELFADGDWQRSITVQKTSRQKPRPVHRRAAAFDGLFPGFVPGFSPEIF